MTQAIAKALKENGVRAIQTWELNGVAHLYPPEWGGKKQTAVKPKPRETAVSLSLSEAQIQQQIIDLLLLDGWLVIRINSGAAVMRDENRERGRFVTFVRWQAPGGSSEIGGVSDLLAVKGDKYLFVEVKDEKGRRRESQERFAAAMELCGGTVLLARSVEDVAPHLEQVKI